jgi:hypothetical protein
MRLEDFAPERLIRLAKMLKEEYAGRNMEVLLFSSSKAAMGFTPRGGEQTPLTIYCQSKLHGYYVYSKEKHEEYLRIHPDSLGSKVGLPFATRIDLPVAATPSCKLSINNRCLLEFQHIYYPSVGGYPTTQGSTQHSGSITLTGHIRGDGTMSDLVVAKAEVNPPERTLMLADWARSNLRTWRFEPTKHIDAVRITYVFEVTDFPSFGQEDGVQFRLPDEVRIESYRAH